MNEGDQRERSTRWEANEANEVNYDPQSAAVMKRPFNPSGGGIETDVVYKGGNKIAQYYDCGCVVIFEERKKIPLVHGECTHHNTPEFNASNLRLYTIIGIIIG